MSIITTNNELSKICKGLCKMELAVDRYHISKSGQYGRHPICKSCRSTASKKLNYTQQLVGEKICYGPLCKEQIKSVQEFHKSKSHHDGLQSCCIICSSYNTRIWSSTFDGFMIKLMGDVKHNCIKRSKDLELSITLEDIEKLYHKQSGKCALTNKILTHTTITDTVTNEYIKHRWNISIDRIDSSKGYTINNIQLVGAVINIMKTDLSCNEFIEICQEIASHN